MKIYSFLFMIIMTLLISSCGSEKSSSSKKTVIITPKQISNLLENQKFECESYDGSQCPEGLARVFVLDLDNPDSSGLCTGFLTDTNQIITNHHCVSNEKQCASTYFSIHISGSYEVARCRKIITAQDDGKPLEVKAIDYSIIELDRHIRNTEVFKYTTSAPRLKSNLTAWVIDHVSLFKARITELRCILKSRKDSLELANCASISGNSGSPILNQSGFIVGVLWGSTTNDSVNELTPLEDRRALEENSYATELKHFRAFLR
jgi:V8-like Glu-specific endopeptidase